MLSRFEQFAFIISGIQREVQKIERDEMVKHGYRGAFAIYLAALSHYDEGLTAKEICEICDKDKAAVSRIITEMEEKDLVTKERNKEKVYRSKIFLTEKGKEIAGIVEKRASAVIKAVSDGVIPENERAHLYKTLDTIYKNLSAVSKNGIPQN